jgi:type I restriction enzyme S subunit
MYEPGTVLLAMYGATIGAASILTFNACTNQACAAFKPCKDVIPEYLYYFLLSRREKFIHDGVGGAQPNISGRYLKQVEFELYPINEQRFVISVLDRVNRIISLKKEEIKKLDELIKARFVEMFGALNNTSYETLPLGDICEFIKDGTHQTPTYTEDKDQGYKFLSSKDVTSQEISWSNIKYIPESLHNELYSKLAPRRGDILLAKNGTTGVAAVVDTDEVFDIYVSLALLRPKVGYNSRYLWAVINSNDTKMQFNANLKGIGVPNLHLGEIKKAKVIVPPLEQQEKFAVFLEQIDKSKVAIQKSLAETQLLFDKLMQDYFG